MLYLMKSRLLLCPPPQVNSASSFSQMGVKGINLPDKFAINHHKKFTLPMNFWTSLLQVGA
jgi:hypothetical protein